MARPLALLLTASVVVAAPARGQTDDFVPYQEPASPGQPAPGVEPAPAPAPPTPAPAAPPATPAPASPPSTSAPAAPASGLPDAAVWAAQYGTACLVPMLAGNLAVIPGLGQVLMFLVPALNGFLVQVVGDALTGRKTSPLAPIIGAYVGQFCVMPVCTMTGVVTFLGLYLGGALGFVYGTTSSRRFDPLTLGAWLGLGAVGGVALGSSICAGLAVSAAVPVAAHAMFARDENAPTAAPPTATRGGVPVAAAGPAALAMAY
jgi:hypothetical protein